MSKHAWIVYNKQSLRKVKSWRQQVRALRDAERLGTDYAIISETKYNQLVSGATKTVRNLMTGQEVEIDINTPLCCDPSSETYWSM